MKAMLMIAVLVLGAAPARAETLTLGNVRIKTVTFPSTDGLKITADLFAPYGADHPLILLFHRAGWSRGEYREIALRLNALGFNALAIDQRAGGKVNGVRNETHRRARAKKLGVAYLDAYADMVAALQLAVEKLEAKTIIVWGSSYSAASVFRLAAEHPQQVAGVVAFSPGEYFRKGGKPTNDIAQFAARVRVPVFIASARAERPQWQPIYDALPAKNGTTYVPRQAAGKHGAQALWHSTPGHDGYWQASEAFLARWAPTKK